MRTLPCFLQSLTQSCLILVAEHLVGLQEQDIFTERAWELPRVSRGKPEKVSGAGRDLCQPLSTAAVPAVLGTQCPNAALSVSPASGCCSQWPT